MKTQTLQKAFIYTGDNPEPGTRPNIYIINPELSETDNQTITDIIFKLNDSFETLDLAYTITAQATQALYDAIHSCADSILEQIAEGEHASVYTYDLLSYLNVNNEDEITELTRECECSIHEACATWYDRKVEEVAFLLLETLTN